MTSYDTNGGSTPPPPTPRRRASAMLILAVAAGSLSAATSSVHSAPLHTPRGLQHEVYEHDSSDSCSFTTSCISAELSTSTHESTVQHVQTPLSVRRFAVEDVGLTTGAGSVEVYYSRPVIELAGDEYQDATNSVTDIVAHVLPWDAVSAAEGEGGIATMATSTATSSTSTDKTLETVVAVEHGIDNQNVEDQQLIANGNVDDNDADTRLHRRMWRWMCKMVRCDERGYGAGTDVNEEGGRAVAGVSTVSDAHHRPCVPGMTVCAGVCYDPMLAVCANNELH